MSGIDFLYDVIRLRGRGLRSDVCDVLVETGPATACGTVATLLAATEEQIGLVNARVGDYFDNLDWIGEWRGRRG